MYPNIFILSKFNIPASPMLLTYFRLITTNINIPFAVIPGWNPVPPPKLSRNTNPECFSSMRNRCSPILRNKFCSADSVHQSLVQPTLPFGQTIALTTWVQQAHQENVVNEAKPTCSSSSFQTKFVIFFDSVRASKRSKPANGPASSFKLPSKFRMFIISKL